jgi:hypothetical protein
MGVVARTQEMGVVAQAHGHGYPCIQEMSDLNVGQYITYHEILHGFHQLFQAKARVVS